MGFSCGDDFGTKQKRVLLVDDQRGRSFMDDRVEFELEFGPVEHPMEPRDEDRPVKCPMPTSSVINESRMQAERLGEGLGKRGEVAAEMNKERNEGGAVRAVRKRHHTLTHEEQVIKPLMRMPPLPPQKITIFEMLHEFHKFES
ncbi:uncharacterized protein LOC123217371 [Mangifera indica]|uniref:uncharacterized protein LOC123217371 n=1 Tax=Mangifera indica TaxID=29780 RepID=UPI001CFC1CB0|nr:uncharacterized protein LOC123217371 [Mangifera indica]